MKLCLIKEELTISFKNFAENINIENNLIGNLKVVGRKKMNDLKFECENYCGCKIRNYVSG